MKRGSGLYGRTAPEGFRRLLNLLLQLAIMAVFAGQAPKASRTQALGSGTSRPSVLAESLDGTGVGPQSKATGALGDHYLMLVNTAISSMMTPEKFTAFDKSPYNGIAVAFWNAYDTSLVIPVASMDAQIAGWKKNTTKDIWPWVYINRMVARSDAENNSHSDDPYFRRLHGADLDGKAGAQADFLQNWQNSLRAARDTGAPGVVFDPEFYNYYKEYELGELARQTGKKPQETEDLLRHLGARMADIAADQYPEATLWVMATFFTRPRHTVIDGQTYYPTPAYIAEGLLDEIQKNHLHLKVLSGGEVSLGYCHPSVGTFRDAIEDRAPFFAPLLRKYQGILELGGTMTMWRDASSRTDLKNEDCAAQTVEDLEPYVELLLRSYRYNWIWASYGAGYNAFGVESASRFNAVIRKAQSQVYGDRAQ